MSDPLTIESLARAIHVDHWDSVALVTGKILAHGNKAHPRNYDELDEERKNVRREQARRMFERIMR